MKRRRVRAAVAGAACTIFLAACGTTDGGNNGGGSTGTVSTSSTAAQEIYVVQKGDTLTGIAGRECGDRGAVVSILDANLGRLQPDGGALVDPDRIRPGWQMILDCSGAGSLSTFTPATTPPTVPPNPGGTVGRQPVPQHTIRLRASDEPAAGDCPGTSSLPSISPWVLRAGAAADGVAMSQGSSLLFVTQEFDGDVTASLVDGRGRRTAIAGSSVGYVFYADPSLPPGDYVIEARSGDQVGSGAVAISRASDLRLVRRSPLDYDIVGGAGSIGFAVYRWAPGACDEDAQAWQESDDLALSGGVGRVRVATGGAPEGTYCLAVRGSGNPADQCFNAERRFLVR